jgi:hypothetical protein
MRVENFDGHIGEITQIVHPSSGDSPEVIIEWCTGEFENRPQKDWVDAWLSSVCERQLREDIRAAGITTARRLGRKVN